MKHASVYFNDNEPFVLPWLENLYPGSMVDGRSIADIQPEEVANYDRAHFFAGIGGWQYALDLAGWPANAPVWTGSCPCQPFSAAGRRQGESDERHLWPELRRLIAECRPPVVFGEQVASNLGRQWLAGVRADLEALGYAVGAADLCAAGAGAPHIRQRLYWVAYTSGVRVGPGALERGRPVVASVASSPEHRSPGRLAYTDERQPGDGELQRGGRHDELAPDEATCGLDDAERSRLEGHAGHGDRGHEPGRLASLTSRPVTEAGRYWDSFDLLYCTDRKARRIEPGTFPLAHGVPGRVGRIRRLRWRHQPANRGNVREGVHGGNSPVVAERIALVYY